MESQQQDTKGDHVGTSTEAVDEKDHSPPSPPAEDAVATWKAGKQEIAVLLTLSCIAFVTGVDAMILMPAFPTLASELHGTTVAIFWAGTSFFLAFSVFLLVIQAFVDIFGRRTLLLSSLALFTLGTIIACTAQGMPQLLAGRTLQGLGCGGVESMIFIIITDIIPLRQRAEYGNYTMLAWGLGAAFGPVIGGAIVRHTTWRWIFYINFPFCAAGLAIVPFTVNLKAQYRQTVWERLRSVDWLGSILFVGSVSSLLMGITWGGVNYPWSSIQTWLPILLGVLGGAASILYELRVAVNPFLRLSMFGSVSATIIFISVLIHGIMIYGYVYYVVFFYQSVRGVSDIQAGLIVMGTNLIVFPAGAATGIYITKRGSYVGAVQLGFVVTTVGNALLFLWDAHRSYAGTIVILLLAGAGIGIQVSSLNPACQALAPPRDAALTVTMFFFIRSFGSCVGTAAGTALFNNLLLKALEDANLPDPAEVATNSEAFVPTLLAMPGGPTKDAYLDAYVSGFRGIFALWTALSAVCNILTVFIKHHNLDTALDSEHRLQRKGKDSSSDSRVPV